MLFKIIYRSTNEAVLVIDACKSGMIAQSLDPIIFMYVTHMLDLLSTAELIHNSQPSG